MTDFEKFVIARWTYSIGKPIISDAEYNILLKAMQVQYPDNEYVHRTWSDDPCPADLLIREGMKQYIEEVTLLDKTESIPSLESLFEIDNVYRCLDEEVSVSMKEDGWNIQMDVYNGRAIALHTRGRATENNIYLNKCLEKLPSTFPFKDKAKIVMEATVPNSIWPEIRKKYDLRSQRGAVRTLMAAGDEALKLEFHATDIISDTLEIPSAGKLFRYLNSLGFKTPEYYIAHNYEELIDSCKRLSTQREFYGVPTDGIVVRGTNTNALRFLAWTPPMLRSYVTGYTSQYGTQSISYGVSIRPIALANSTQKQVTCTNLKRIINNNLRIGAPVAFKFTSEAIGVLDEDATRALQLAYPNWDAYHVMIDYDEERKEESSG